MFVLYVCTMLHTYTFDGHIWKIRIDTHQNWAIVEIRNGETYTTSFNILDLVSATYVQKDWIFNEPWLIGIEDIDRGKLYLHHYRSPDLPEHCGIEVYDIVTQHLLWSQPTYTWYKRTHKGIIAHNLTEEGIRHFVLLDLEDGHLIESFGESIPIVLVEESQTIEEESFSLMQFPTAILLDKPENTPTLQFFRTFAPKLKFHYAEYLELGDTHILSYYAMNQGVETSMRNDLVIYDALTQTNLAHITLGDNLHKFAVDSFYLWKNYLFFIQNKGTLCIYTL